MNIPEIVKAFGTPGQYVSHDRYGQGHIHDTFLVHFSKGSVKTSTILQKINTKVFQDPERLMVNICLVTGHLRNKILQNRGDIGREVLTVMETAGGKPFYKENEHSFWRMYAFIEDTYALEQIEHPRDLYESGRAFGRFQYLLSDFDASTLGETIPDFHNTPLRYEALKEAISQDFVGRVCEARNEIQFIQNYEQELSILRDAYKEGRLPLRVTHNDTKLNNVLLDHKTGRGLCVIDLDTVMPGLSAYDFGDAIRFGANQAQEDEPDLSKVALDLERYAFFTKGFLEGCGGHLTDAEIDMLPMGAKIITLEQGLRFLTDYLNGDRYYRIHHKRQNLDRCRTQLKLVEDMEQKWEAMSQR